MWVEEVQIRISAGDRISEYAALWEWLRAERELAGRVRAVRRPPTEGEMGDGLDLIAIGVSSLGVLVALAQTLPAYLGTRRSRVHLILRKPNGEEFEISTENVRGGEIAPLVQEFLQRDSDGT